MTRITLQDGEVVLRDGKVGTEKACCCGEDEPCEGPCDEDADCGPCCKCNFGNCVPICEGNFAGMQNGFCDFEECCVNGCCEPNPCGGRSVLVEVVFTAIKNPFAGCVEYDPPFQVSTFAAFDSCIQPAVVTEAPCETTITFADCEGSATIDQTFNFFGCPCAEGSWTLDNVITTVFGP